MRLSEAIILGDTLKISHPGMWLSPSGSCGCGVGGAMLAAGIAKQYLAERVEKYGSSIYSLEPDNSKVFMTQWPWVTRDILEQLTHLYKHKHNGHITIEDVAAYVRTVEPPELSEAVPACNSKEHIVLR
jgi:hypothetical protein